MKKMLCNYLVLYELLIDVRFCDFNEFAEFFSCYFISFSQLLKYEIKQFVT